MSAEEALATERRDGLMADRIHAQLGNGGTSAMNTAGAISELGGGIVEIARGTRHTLVLKGE